MNDQILKQTGPSGIVKKGQGIQIIYGPSVTVVKSNLEDYLVNAPDEEYLAPDEENVEEKEVRETTPQNTEAKTTKKYYVLHLPERCIRLLIRRMRRLPAR